MYAKICHHLCFCSCVYGVIKMERARGTETPPLFVLSFFRRLASYGRRSAISRFCETSIFVTFLFAENFRFAQNADGKLHIYGFGHFLLGCLANLNKNAKTKVTEIEVSQTREITDSLLYEGAHQKTSKTTKGGDLCSARSSHFYNTVDRRAKTQVVTDFRVRPL